MSELLSQTCFCIKLSTLYNIVTIYDVITFSAVCDVTPKLRYRLKLKEKNRIIKISRVLNKSNTFRKILIKRRWYKQKYFWQYAESDMEKCLRRDHFANYRAKNRISSYFGPQVKIVCVCVEREGDGVTPTHQMNFT